MSELGVVASLCSAVGETELREVDYTRLWSHGLRALAGGGAGSVVQNLCSQAGAFPLHMARFPDDRVLS